MRAKNDLPLETAEQQALIKWAAFQSFAGMVLGDFLFAIPNGGSRSKNSRHVSIEAIRLKAEGVRAGVPDLMLAIPANGYHGLFIEMKRASRSRSRISPQQRAWGKRLAGRGYKVIIAFGFEAAKTGIRDYLGNDFLEKAA